MSASLSVLAGFSTDARFLWYIGLHRLHEGLQKLLEGTTAKLGILIMLAFQSQL